VNYRKLAHWAREGNSEVFLYPNSVLNQEIVFLSWSSVHLLDTFATAIMIAGLCCPRTDSTILLLEGKAMTVTSQKSRNNLTPHVRRSTLNTAWNKYGIVRLSFCSFVPATWIFQSIFVCVRFKVLTAAIMKFRVFWDVSPCSLVGVDLGFRGSTHLWNVDLLQRDYMALHPRTL
jgi:hypothetical protein